MPEITPPPLANDPAARTPTGEIKDAGSPSLLTPKTETPPATTTTTEVKPDAPATAPAKAPDGPPETYTFKAPDGQTLDKATLDAATPIFKELGLNQAAADKLVDFYNAQMKAISDNSLKARNDMIDKWSNEVKADQTLGPKLDQVKADIGRMKDIVFEGDSAARKAFDDAVDLTGAGWNPAIIKAFAKIAQRINEGKPVSGGGPSPHGQTNSGRAERPSIAEAMYPGLRAQ